MNLRLIKYLVLFAAVPFLVTSCGEPDKAIYNGGLNDQTLVTLSQQSLNLPVVVNSTGSVTVQLDVSAKANHDRSFDLVVVDSANLTTADPSTFNFPASVTVPANKYTGTFEIVGVDHGSDVTLQPKKITFKVVGQGMANTIYESNIGTVSIFQVCPVPSDFLYGMYHLEDGTASIGPANGFQNFGTADVMIDTVPGKPSLRVFQAQLFATAGPVRTVKLKIQCGHLLLADTLDTGFYCTQGTHITYAATTVANSTVVNVQNPQPSYTVKYIEDPLGSCNGPHLSTFILTKL